jgi:diamine N-acetyltransferase
METPDFSIVSIELRDIDSIRPLWEEHNAFHASVSPHFSGHFKSMTFERRKAEFCEKAGKGEVRTQVSVHQATGEVAGYCVSNVIGGRGEIDSLFVKKNHRGRGVGRHLVEAAIAWMRSLGADDIAVTVAIGNEDALKFYRRFGLAPRLVLLSRLPDTR